MKKKKYLFEQLSISFNDKSKPYRVDKADDVEFQGVSKVIEEAVLGEKLKHLQSFYDDEDYYIDVEAEGFRSAIVVYDELHGISYSYINDKYAGREECVELADYYLTQMCICEDTNILLDIIITFLETGKPCERYKWFEEED